MMCHKNLKKMKKVFLFVLLVPLGLAMDSCKEQAVKENEVGLVKSSDSPKKGLAIYVADPGKDISEGGSCQIVVSKLRPVGKPLTESQIDFYDQKEGRFKLKVMQYDWLSENLQTILGLRRYSALAITLDGKPIFGGYALTFLDSYACTSDAPYFMLGDAHLNPNPKRPDTKDERNYWLRIVKTNFPNTPEANRVPKLNAQILQRLEKIGKLKN